MVPSRPGIAFVEYSDEVQAGLALQGLQGFKLATGEAGLGGLGTARPARLRRGNDWGIEGAVLPLGSCGSGQAAVQGGCRALRPAVDPHVAGQAAKSDRTQPNPLPRCCVTRAPLFPPPADKPMSITYAKA